jgi:hypothetical protein
MMKLKCKRKKEKKQSKIEKAKMIRKWKHSINLKISHFLLAFYLSANIGNDCLHHNNNNFVEPSKKYCARYLESSVHTKNNI